jgi:hypothetical protein
MSTRTKLIHKQHITHYCPRKSIPHYNASTLQREDILYSTPCNIPTSTGRESIAKEFEDTKGVIKIRKFQDRQHNGQKKKEKQWSTKHNTENYRLRNTSPAKNGVCHVSIFLSLRYPRGCGSCQDFLNRGLLLTRKPLNQGLLLANLKSSLRKLYDRNHLLCRKVSFLANPHCIKVWSTT